MSALLTVVVLVVLFAGSHVGLASERVRSRLVAGLGERGFFVLYSVIAVALYALLVNRYAVHRFDGPPGPALAAVPLLRWPLMVLATSGITLAGAGIVAYPRLPSALFDQLVRTPYGIERVSRHPFFAGFALFAIAHMLLVTHLVSSIVFAGLAWLAIVGARHQDHKLAARRGAVYTNYVAQTSFWPLAAQLSGRPLVAKELPWMAFAGSVLVALWLRRVHASLFAYDGSWVILVLIAGAAVAATGASRRARRKAGTT
jgi:uncharacterized membrane protein